MIIKHNVHFFLERRKKDGVLIVENVPIRMRVKFNGNCIDFTTGHRIDTSKWEGTKQRVKNGCTNKAKVSASIINADLLTYHAEIQNVFKDFELKDIMPTTELVKNAFNLRINPTIVPKNIAKEKDKKEMTFWEVYDRYVEEYGRLKNWTESTYKKYKTQRNHLLKFGEDLSFDFFSYNGLNDYVEFLREDEDLREETVGKQLGFLKSFFGWSLNNGYHSNRAYQTFKPKLNTTDKVVIYLTLSELKQLINYEIPETKQYLERVRDVFLFCCFTGLRYSDVHNLRRSDVKETKIEGIAMKTRKSIDVNLNVHAKNILNKYKDVEFPENKALPVISNQRMNEYIKELAELAGIDEPVHETYFKGNQRIDTITPKYALLSSHAGRRTFVCTGLTQGIPADVVMKWTGHSDYRAMKPYIAIADQIKAQEMEKFNNLNL